MVSIDEHTSNAIEIVSQSAKLTEQLLLSVMGALLKALEKNPNSNEMFIKDNSKEGKQKLNDLVNKHKDGVEALEENITKVQLKDYQKEFKKLGVDFSVVKNDKDNFSFFFASSQSNIIEKALKNIVEHNSELINDEKVKSAKLDLDSEMNNLSSEEKENVLNVYSKYISNTNELENEQGSDSKDNLNDKEKKAFDMLEKLDETKKEVSEEIKKSDVGPPTEKQLKLADKLGVENIENMNKKEISIALENAGAEQSFYNNKESTKEILNDRISKLNDSELDFFTKRIEYDSLSNSPTADQNKIHKLASELKELENKSSTETLDKINSIDKDIKSIDNFNSSSRDNKLNTNEILNELKDYKKNKEIDKNISNSDKTFSLDNVRKIDNKIKSEEAKEKKVKHQEQSR